MLFEEITWKYGMLTWVCHDRQHRIFEVTAPPDFSIGLVVEVHGYRSMGQQIVWVETRATLTQHAVAVHLRAGKV